MLFSPFVFGLWPSMILQKGEMETNEITKHFRYLKWRYPPTQAELYVRLMYGKTHPKSCLTRFSTFILGTTTPGFFGMKESLACFSRIYFHIVDLDLKWWNLLPSCRMHAINSYRKTWVLELFVSLNMFYLRIYSVLTTTTSETHPKRTWRAIAMASVECSGIGIPTTIRQWPGTSKVRMSWKDCGRKFKGGIYSPWS